MASCCMQVAESGDPSSSPVDWTITILAFLFPAVGGLLFGYDIGATSGALISLTNATTSGTDWYNLTAFQSGLVVSMSLAGALAGSVGAFLFGDKLGRRSELLLSAVLYGGSAALMYTAPSLTLLLAGRGLYGAGIGFAMHAAPAYVAETAPSQVRGLLISLKEGFIVGGILLGYSASYFFVNEVGGWRTMFGAALFPALALGGGMLWLMESPRWLQLSGASTEATTAALRRLRGRYGTDAAVQAELAGMTRNLEASQQAGMGASALRQLFQPRNLRPLLIGLSLMLFQQITGQPSVLYYASKIFQAAGFPGAQEATRVSVILGIFKLLMTGVAVLTVDKLGRRPLLLTGVCGMAAALLALGFVETLAASLGGSTAAVSVVALLLYVGCYQMRVEGIGLVAQVSFGPISWLLVGELFPLSVRGQAVALATLTNFASNFGVSLVLPSLQGGLGINNTYLLFAAISTVAVVTIYLTVPETKGKTLEEIEALFSTDGKSE